MVDSPPDVNSTGNSTVNSTVNRTKEELRKLFWTLNISSIIVEPPPPTPSSESGSSSGDSESGVNAYIAYQQ